MSVKIRKNETDRKNDFSFNANHMMNFSNKASDNNVIRKLEFNLSSFGENYTKGKVLL